MSDCGSSNYYEDLRFRILENISGLKKLNFDVIDIDVILDLLRAKENEMQIKNKEIKTL